MRYFLGKNVDNFFGPLCTITDKPAIATWKNRMIRKNKQQHQYRIIAMSSVINYKITQK